MDFQFEQEEQAFRGKARGGYYHRLLAPNFDGSEEQREAQRAFLEKRPPDFSKVRLGGA